MKIKFSSIIASTVLAAGLASMSATAAFASDNVFADLASESKIGESKNDDVGTIESLFGQQVIDGYDLDDYKVDSKEGDNDYFKIAQTSKGEGTLTFLDSSLANSTFALVLKAGNGFDAYLFDGIDVSQEFNWTTANGKDLSHATLYVFEQGTTSLLSQTGPSKRVPEPATALGLMAVGGMLVGKKVLSRKS